MTKLVKLNFVGSFENDFTVSVDISDQKKARFVAKSLDYSLSSDVEIPNLYEIWRSAYEKLGPPPRISLGENRRTNRSSLEDRRNCRILAKQLSARFNKWLGPGTSFGVLRELLFDKINRDDEVRIFLVSNDNLLQRLPWHSWDLFSRYPNAEFALSAPAYDFFDKKYLHSDKNNILAIFGGDEDIDISGDLQAIKSLPNTDTDFLSKPHRKQLNAKLLEDKRWDILFFTGHSCSQLDEGIICINDTDSLNLEELSGALEHAVSNGLQLAIFNSCDGLGLAQTLLKLNIPQVIVMREPIADKVAEEFLKYFLSDFANGTPLYLAVRKARKQLQGMEDEYPCASWLPMICQNPAEDSLIWKKAPDTPIETVLSSFETPETSETKPPESATKPPERIFGNNFFAELKKIFASRIGFLFILFMTAIVLAKIFSLLIDPVPVNINERISHGEKFLISSERLSLRNNLSANAFDPTNWDETIKKFRNYLYNNEQNITSKTPLKKNDPEALIYLNNAIAEKSGKYLTIAVSVPIVEDPAYLMGVSEEILRGVAQVQNEVNQGEEKQRINGNFLKVVIAKDDNASKNDDVVKAIAKKFVEDESILAVVGHNSTKASLAAADTYKGKLLAISPTSNGDKLSDVIYYRTLPSIATDADVLASYAKKQEWNKIGICFDQTDESSKSLKESFAIKFTTNGYSVEDKNCDFSLKEKINADIVISNLPADFKALILLPSINGIDLAIKIAEANSKRKLPLLASSVMYTGETLTSGKNSVESMVVATIWHPEFSKAFADSAQTFWSDSIINWRTATSYDAMQVIIAGLKNNSDPIRKNLMEFVSSSKLDMESSAGIKNSQKNNKIIFKPNDGGRDAEIRLLKIVANEKTSTRSYDFRPLDENFNPLLELTERK
ncbi:MAG: CHAT domain-containing protein [Pseudanabaena sp. Salubria-1]|nr:CHAT domain-containing protein [Pseudanabaena sp. Salubria-1]